MAKHNGVRTFEDTKLQQCQERQISNHRDTSVHASDRRSMDNGLSDTESEGGTYTIDKNNEQVKQARKSIDQVFGISSENENELNASVRFSFNVSAGTIRNDHGNIS